MRRIDQHVDFALNIPDDAMRPSAVMIHGTERRQPDVCRIVGYAGAEAYVVRCSCPCVLCVFWGLMSAHIAHSDTCKQQFLQQFFQRKEPKNRNESVETNRELGRSSGCGRSLQWHAAARWCWPPLISAEYLSRQSVLCLCDMHKHLLEYCIIFDVVVMHIRHRVRPYAGCWTDMMPPSRCPHQCFVLFSSYRFRFPLQVGIRSHSASIMILLAFAQCRPRQWHLPNSSVCMTHLRLAANNAM